MLDERDEYILKKNNESIKLPDIHLIEKYHTKGWSINQKIYNNKIEEIVKKKFETPENIEAIKNKYLKSHCKNI